MIRYDPYDTSTARQSGFPLRLSEAEVDAYYALGKKLFTEAGGTSRIMHRLLGHPDEVQGSMRDDLPREPDDAEANYEQVDSSDLAAPRSPDYAFQPSPWHLLLQLDTDDATGMSWGDTGRLYFWIRDRDLQRRDFDRVVLLYQDA